MFPWSSMVTCFGSLRRAATAAPPSPAHPGSPIPAIVTMFPTLSVVVMAFWPQPSVEIPKNCVAHFCGPDDAGARSLNVLGPIAEIQGLHNRLLNRRGFLIQLESIRQHHRGRGNRGNRVRNILSGNIRRASVNRFEEPNLHAQTCGGQHADRAG